jgi:hypothetical protein
MIEKIIIEIDPVQEWDNQFSELLENELGFIL